MPVDRCVCFNISFADLRAYALEHDAGETALRERFGCGRGCAMCVPFIRAMLATGCTSFDAADPALEDRPKPPI